MDTKNTGTIGRRKEAVARVYTTSGSGKITVNGKDYKHYFALMYLQNQVEQPLKVVEALDKFDINVNVAGGGLKGQAEAIKLGIARALCELNADLRPALKAAGLMRRDPRSVQRKMFGHKKARRSYQFSKR
jgi:small subunit ribosomal protein S9